MSGAAYFILDTFLLMGGGEFRKMLTKRSRGKSGRIMLTTSPDAARAVSGHPPS
jgi:hypothetical protein